MAATSDRAEIKRMFGAPSARLIAIPTGKINNLIVVDVDIKNGQPGMDWLNENSEALPQTRTHKTRSGGLHLLFRPPAEVEIRNSASRVAPGVDVRGEGGYVIIPPSDGYQVADATDPAEMPRWLIRACLRPESPVASPPKAHDPITEGGSLWGLTALDGEIEEIKRAPFGRQEITLNEAALKIGAIVAGGHLSESVARQALISAGNTMSSASGDRPWTSTEIEEKITRGMKDGAASPRRPKDRILNGNHQKPYVEPQKVNVDELQQVPPRKDNSKHPEVFEYFTFADAVLSIEVEDFVEGLLIENAMSVVYGESNSGKTFWTTDMALHVAAGRSWNGREVKQGPVVYCALEGAHGIKNRIAAFKEYYGMEDQIIPFVVIPVSMNLLDPNADADTLVATIRDVVKLFDAKDAILIIIDTLSRALAGGNENAPEDMGALVSTGDKIRALTKAHLAWIHHSGKDTAKGARGHSSLRAASDTEIEITVDGQVRQAQVRKQRDLEGGDIFPFTLTQVVLGQNRRGKDVTSCIVQPSDNQAAGAATDRRRSLKGHTKRALDVLVDLIAASGESGHGAPPGCVSVPEKWWRERFYESAMPGAEQKAKEKAFRRSADQLLGLRLVGMMRGRVWVVFTSFSQNSGDKSGDI